MKKTRLFSLFLALALCLSVAGCKGSGDPQYYSYWESDYEVVGGSANTSGDKKTEGNDSKTDNNSSSKNPSASNNDKGSNTSSSNKGGSSSGNSGANNNTSSSNKGGSTSSSSKVTASVDKDEAAQYVDKDNLALRKEYEAKHDVYNHPELKGKTVEFATWIDHTTTEAKYAMETFEKTTGIKVKWIEIPQAGYDKAVLDRIAAGNAPDVWVTVGDGFPSDMYKGQPINKISTFDINDPIWNKDWLDTYKVGKNYYMVNTVNSIWCGGDLIYYNRSLFEDNGLLTPADYEDNGEWSLEAMMEIMKAVNGLGDQYTGGLIDPKLMAASLGAGIGYWKNGTLHNGLNDNRTYQAWKYLYNAIDLGYYKKGVTMTDFAQGRVGLWMADIYGMKKSGYFPSMNGETLSWIRLPSKINKNDKDSGSISAIPRGYGVCMGAKNPEAAVIFLRYFLDPLNYDWDSVFKNEEAKEYYLELIDVSKDQRIYDCVAPVFVSTANTEGTLGYTLCNTTSGQLKATLDSVAPRVKKIIADHNAKLKKMIDRDK